MDKKYWENYYKRGETEEEPSLFAMYVLNDFLKEGDRLIELGCGNGRDAVFFARHNINVLAIDQCDGILCEISDRYQIGNLEVMCSDFTELKDLGKFDFVYSRFTMHIISSKQEDKVIDWAYNSLNHGGKFLIEARGHKNELYKLGQPVADEPHAYIHDNHYRRFISLENLKSKLKERGFKILHAVEDKGFAPFKDTDFHFIRIVASR